MFTILFPLAGMALFMLWIMITDVWLWVSAEIKSWDGVLDHADQVFKYKTIK